MILKSEVITQTFFLFLLNFVIQLTAGVAEVPSRPQIPQIFDAAGLQYENSYLDLNMFFQSDSLKDRIVGEFYPAVSGYGPGNLSYSFYGNNTISNGSKPFDYHMHRLFISKAYEKLQISTGIGYDCDKKREVKILESLEYSGNTIVGKKSELTAVSLDENSMLGNVNGYISFDKCRKGLFGAEIIYSVKRGVEYQEQVEYSRYSYLNSRDDINYYDYDKGAYGYSFKAGAGLLKEYLSKRGDRRMIVVNLLYERLREYSELSVLNNVCSYFYQRLPDDVQFSGKDNYQNSFVFNVLFDENEPDAFYLNKIKGSLIHQNLKFMNIELSMSEIKNKTKSVNQWTIGDTYYGVKERISAHYPFALKLDVVSELYFFSCFHIRLQTVLDGMLEFYSKNKIVGECILNIVPYIGSGILLRNGAFIDLNFSIVALDAGIYRGINQFNYGLELYPKYFFQMRISLLRKRTFRIF